MYGPMNPTFPRPLTADCDVDAKLMPGNIKIALSATRIMQEQPRRAHASHMDMASQSQSILCPAAVYKQWV